MSCLISRKSWDSANWIAVNKWREASESYLGYFLPIWDVLHKVCFSHASAMSHWKLRIGHEHTLHICAFLFGLKAYRWVNIDSHQEDGCSSLQITNKEIIWTKPSSLPLITHLHICLKVLNVGLTNSPEIDLVQRGEWVWNVWGSFPFKELCSKYR